MAPPDRSFLFDLETDPAQENPLDDPRIEETMCAKMGELMRANDAPPELFERLGLDS
jgi:hypothetical protein